MFDSNGPVAVEALIESADRAHEQVCIAQREFFRLIAEIDRTESWADHGARDMAHWLWMRYGVSDWKARRWIACSHALEALPAISSAFACGALGVDKVVELTRFATPSSEEALLRWAERVSPFAIRRKGDLLERREALEAAQVERDRFLRWTYVDDGRRWALEGELSAADGAVVSRALDRVAATLPDMPGEEGLAFADARRADALRALCGSRIAHDADPDRATVIVHTRAGVRSDGWQRARGRPRSSSGRRQTAGLHGARPGGPGSELRRPTSDGADHQGAIHGIAASGAVPGRRMRLSRLRRQALHRGAPCPVVELGRAYRH